ncbi:hypothetical protein VTI74DRAFT_8081 [Chaetomium olivicolor]
MISCVGQTSAMARAARALQSPTPQLPYCTLRSLDRWWGADTTETSRPSQLVYPVPGPSVYHPAWTVPCLPHAGFPSPRGCVASRIVATTSLFLRTRYFNNHEWILLGQNDQEAGKTVSSSLHFLPRHRRNSAASSNGGSGPVRAIREPEIFGIVQSTSVHRQNCTKVCRQQPSPPCYSCEHQQIGTRIMTVAASRQIHGH